MIDVYVAIPYSDDNIAVRIQRFDIATKYAAQLVMQGLVVYSPITHAHPMAQMEPALGYGWTTWQRQDEIYIPLCKELHVLKVGDWQHSKGVTAEIEAFKKLNRPIRYIGRS
jgi:hypothetical protein